MLDKQSSHHPDSTFIEDEAELKNITEQGKHIAEIKFNLELTFNFYNFNDQLYKVVSGDPGGDYATKAKWEETR